MLKLSKLKYLLIGLVVGSLISVSFVIASPTVRLVVDGVDITYKSDVPPQIINGRTLVPARVLAESLGATVSWDEASRTVVVNSEAHLNQQKELDKKQNIEQLRKNVDYISGKDLVPTIERDLSTKGFIVNRYKNNIYYIEYANQEVVFEDHEYYEYLDEAELAVFYRSYDKLLTVFDKEDLDKLPKYKFSQIQQ